MSQMWWNAKKLKSFLFFFSNRRKTFGSAPSRCTDVLREKKHDDEFIQLLRINHQLFCWTRIPEHSTCFALCKEFSRSASAASCERSNEQPNLELVWPNTQVVNSSYELRCWEEFLSNCWAWIGDHSSLSCWEILHLGRINNYHLFDKPMARARNL